MAIGAMIAEIALKAKQEYDKTGERAMNHIEKAFKQQTEERQSNSGWTGSGGTAHAQPHMKKDKDEDEKAEEKAKEPINTDEAGGGKGGVVEQLTGAAGGGDGDTNGKTGGSWLEDVLNTVGNK